MLNLNALRMFQVYNQPPTLPPPPPTPPTFHTWNIEILFQLFPLLIVKYRNIYVYFPSFIFHVFFIFLFAFTYVHSQLYICYMCFSFASHLFRHPLKVYLLNGKKYWRLQWGEGVVVGRALEKIVELKGEDAF